MAKSKEKEQDDFRQHLRQADKFIIEGDFEGAKAELAAAKQLDPRNPFILAFQERISVFKGKKDAPAKGTEPEDQDGESGVETAPAATARARGGDRSTASPAAESELRMLLEEEYKQKYTEELRQAEERAKKLLAEEKAALEKNFLKQRLENEREFEQLKLRFEKEYQDNLAAEIGKTERRMDGEYQSELARLEGDLRTKMDQDLQARLIEEKERLKSELRGLAEKERQSAGEVESALRAEFEKRREEETKKAREEVQQQLQEQHRREEEKLKILLTEEFEERLKYEEKKLREELEKNAKKGEDAHRLELNKARQAGEALEKKLREEFNRKLLESVRKAETAYEEQAGLRIKEEQEKLRKEMATAFQAEQEKERKSLKEEYEKLKASVEKNSQEEMARMKQQGEARLAEQVASARKQLAEEFEKKAAGLRNELESKYQKEYEAKLAEERAKVHREADQKIAAEKERLEAEYQRSLAEQNQKLQSVRKELRAGMEAELIKRMESLADEYETKLDLLGIRQPETKAEQVNFYREAMMARYLKGDLDVEDAKKLLQLKELLGLSFDEHLTIEAEVRVKTYSDRIREGIRSGSLNPEDRTAIEKLKQKYGISDDESRDLEHHLLASFGKLQTKGRILVVDDDKLLCKTIEGILTDAGYHVVTAGDIDSAFDALKTMPFDLILSDIKFSDNEFEGFAFFKKVQGVPQYAGLPFIFMSALSDGVIVRSGVQLGVDDYLTKPIEPELLTAVIEGKLKRFRALKFQ